MLVEITGCSDTSYWYFGRIGEQYQVLQVDNNSREYVVRTPSGYTNIIKFEDSIEIED